MIYHETNSPYLSAFKEPPAETSRMLRIPEHTLHAETHTHTMRVTFPHVVMVTSLQNG